MKCFVSRAWEVSPPPCWLFRMHGCQKWNEATNNPDQDLQSKEYRSLFVRTKLGLLEVRMSDFREYVTFFLENTMSVKLANSPDNRNLQQSHFWLWKGPQMTFFGFSAGNPPAPWHTLSIGVRCEALRSMVSAQKGTPCDTCEFFLEFDLERGP